ncbi:hypothetical protein [Peribacillus deserti]|uniref:Single cache domain-containing protein n=1 Tax=Peribacillus deserti TaxID=673318 RepID=A0A2N5M5Y3_9BACI|nr:hypothetical protein [Peribacillus deserti]PLT29774.1 hypothetical protein CUU66_11345 [Peribacillus deserti]
MKRGRLSLQAIIIIFVCIVVAFSLGITDLLISHRVTSSVEDTQKEKALDVARMVSQSPAVIHALDGSVNKNEIQPFANQIRKVTYVNFVVVMNMEGIRLSHPQSNEIRKHFRGGDEGPALQGKEYVSYSKGTLGHSMRGSLL